MKLPPNHLIPETALSENILSEAAERFSTPLYVYDSGRIARDFAELKALLPEPVEVLYSMKANPSMAVVSTMIALGAGLELSSSGELSTALAIGADPSKAVYVGPGKTDLEIGEAIDAGAGLIVAESPREVGRIDAAARERGTSGRVLLRINPGFGHGEQHMGGPTQFGMDVESALSLLEGRDSFPNVKFSGVQGYMGTRLLRAEYILANFKGVLSAASTLQSRSGMMFTTVDIGGGFGVPLYHGEGGIDSEPLRKGLEKLVATYLEKHRHTRRILVESGRFLSARAGVFVTRVIDVKTVGRKNFVIVDGGIHAIGGRDGYIGAKVSPMAVLGRSADICEVTVCGPLCTPADRIAARVLLPMPEPGDLIAVYVAGAYGSTASAGFFLSRGFPAEAFLSDGELKLARSAIGAGVLIDAQRKFVKGAL